MRRVLVVAGLALLAAAPFPTRAHAGPELGSGFGPYSLAANAPSVQVRVDDPSLCFKSAAAENGCEGVIPEAVSTLRSGPIGHGLAAVVWPGGIAAGAGSLLITLGGSSVPPQASMLNDPVRADAYTNVGPSTQSYDAVPGTTMTATALTDHVSATAAVGESTTVPVGTVGSSAARSSVRLAGVGLAVATSHSEVRDVSLAGVVHIASVVSDASATTDGIHASAKGATTVSGVTVAGTPVTVDDNGVHVQGQGGSVKAEEAAVNSALAPSGMRIALGAPNGVPQGGSVAYNAQSLVVVFTNPTGFTETVVLGGANVSVTATPAFAVPESPVQAAPVAAPPGAASPGLGSPVASGPPPPTVGVTAAGPPPPAVTGDLAAADLPEPGPIPTHTVLLALAGAGLLAAGARRLPDHVLRSTPAACHPEELT